MPLARPCSECGGSLEGKAVQTKTCSNACRLKRSRRAGRQRREAEEEGRYPAATQEVAAIVRREAPDVVTHVMHNELQPIVREALTEDVLAAVKGMLGLTPRAVEQLTEDLDSKDSTVRQRAYTLVLKYTVGHPALLKPEDAEGSGQLVVHFNLPRPDDAHEPDQPAEAEELHECDMCHEDKLASEFEAGSSRCRECFKSWSAAIREQFA